MGIIESVSEFQKNLVDRVYGLGVSVDFLSHPGFVSTLSEINYLIDDIGIKDPNIVQVETDDDRILFNCVTDYKDSFGFELRASDKKVHVVRFCDRYIPLEGILGIEVEEIVSSLDDDGNVVILFNAGLCDNLSCDRGHYKLASLSQKTLYDQDGVMKEKDFKSYPEQIFSGEIESLDTDEILAIARGSSRDGSLSEAYTERKLLKRDMLDTASVVEQDRLAGYEYSGIVPLDVKRGLKDMHVASEYTGREKPAVNIHPLMETEVEALISGEVDERVANGLRKYAVGRTTYRYSSNGDGQNSNSPKVM